MTPEYEPITIEDRGVHIVPPIPKHVGLTLELLAGADPRVIHVRRSMIYLGSDRSVAFQVTGIDEEGVLQLSRWDTPEALDALPVGGASSGEGE